MRLAFTEAAEPQHVSQGLVVAIGKGVANVSTGASVLRNVTIAQPLTAEHLTVGDYVALLWVGDRPYITNVLGHETALRLDPYQDTTPPPAPTDVRVVQGSNMAYLAWSYSGAPADPLLPIGRIIDLSDVAYFEVDAKQPGGSWGYDVYPVSEGTRMVHYGRANGPLYCRVRAVDFRGNKSAWTECAEVLRDTVPPPVPTNFRVYPRGMYIECVWDGPTIANVADLAGFYLYYTDDAEASATGEEYTGEYTKDRVPLGLSYSLPFTTHRYLWLNLSSFDTMGNESALAGDWQFAYSGSYGMQLLTNGDFERQAATGDMPQFWAEETGLSGAIEWGAYGMSSASGVKATLASTDGSWAAMYWPSGYSEWQFAVTGVPFTASIYYLVEGVDASLVYLGPDCPSGMLGIDVAFLFHNGSTRKGTFGSPGPDGMPPLGGEYGYPQQELPPGWKQGGGLPGGWTRAYHSVVITAEHTDNGTYPYIGMYVKVTNRTGTANVKVYFDRAMMELGGPEPHEWSLSASPPLSSSGTRGLSVDAGGIKACNGDTPFVLRSNGRLGSALIPHVTSSYNLGDTSLVWSALYANSAYLGSGLQVTGSGGIQSSGDVSSAADVIASGNFVLKRSSTEYPSHVLFDHGIVVTSQDYTIGTDAATFCYVYINIPAGAWVYLWGAMDVDCTSYSSVTTVSSWVSFSVTPTYGQGSGYQFHAITGAYRQGIVSFTMGRWDTAQSSMSLSLNGNKWDAVNTILARGTHSRLMYQVFV